MAIKVYSKEIDTKVEELLFGEFLQVNEENVFIRNPRKDANRTIYSPKNANFRIIVSITKENLEVQNIINLFCWAFKMTQQIKVLAAKPDNLSLIP